jgi:hypothetical protein
MRIAVVTPPAEEPITLAEAKLHLRRDTAFTADDSLITSLISAARRMCEAHVGQAFVTQTLAMHLDGFPTAGGYYNREIRQAWASAGGIPGGFGFQPGMVPNSTGVIDLLYPPLQSVSSVRYYDFSGTLQTVDPSAYVVSPGTPGRIQAAYSRVWPVSRPTVDAVVITFVAGYGAASAVPDNVKAAMKLIVGHLYENREWVGSGTIFTTVPNSVDALLAASDHGSYT